MASSPYKITKPDQLAGLVILSFCVANTLLVHNMEIVNSLLKGAVCKTPPAAEKLLSNFLYILNRRGNSMIRHELGTYISLLGLLSFWMIDLELFVLPFEPKE